MGSSVTPTGWLTELLKRDLGTGPVERQFVPPSRQPTRIFPGAENGAAGGGAKLVSPIDLITGRIRWQSLSERCLVSYYHTVVQPYRLYCSD